jgi:hypothetical protein
LEALDVFLGVATLSSTALSRLTLNPCHSAEYHIVQYNFCN